MDDTKQLQWAIEARGKSQALLFKVYELGGDDPISKFKSKEFASIYGLLSGAAFSLWRAAFLSDVAADISVTLSDSARFLKKVLTDNTVTFAVEQNHKDWTFGYYHNNAKIRLLRAIERLPEKPADAAKLLDKCSSANNVHEAWIAAADLLDVLADSLKQQGLK